MNTFIVIAAVMAAVAAGAVAMPLLRDRQSRIQGAIAAVLIVGAAAGLYPLWSNWNWHAPAAAQGPGGPDVAAMVAKLEKRLSAQPNDVAGWLMLGRSYLALERLDDAIAAYDHARMLDPQSAEAVMGLGEAMSLRAGGEITPPAAQYFEQALALAPGNPMALLYAGFAAAARGDRALGGAEEPASAAAHHRNAGCADRGTRRGGARRGGDQYSRAQYGGAGDECVARGDEHERGGLKRGGGRCQYHSCT